MNLFGAWPPIKLSGKNENDTVENMHQTLFLQKEFSSIFVVNEGILLDSRVPQFLQHPTLLLITHSEFFNFKLIKSWR